MTPILKASNTNLYLKPLVEKKRKREEKDIPPIEKKMKLSTSTHNSFYLSRRIDLYIKSLLSLNDDQRQKKAIILIGEYGSGRKSVFLNNVGRNQCVVSCLDKEFSLAETNLNSNMIFLLESTGSSLDLSDLHTVKNKVHTLVLLVRNDLPSFSESFFMHAFTKVFFPPCTDEETLQILEKKHPAYQKNLLKKVIQYSKSSLQKNPGASLRLIKELNEFSIYTNEAPTESLLEEIQTFQAGKASNTSYFS